MQALARVPALVDRSSVPSPRRASVSASARRSQAAWNTGSSGSGATGPKPAWPPRSCGPFMAPSGSPVPIIESRVTRPASAASSSPSLPAGRIGTTR